MATVVDVTGSNTPNTGRTQWNANINAINAEVISATAAIAAATGGLVGRTQVQTLTNKVLVSSYRGGTNTFSISRRDLETSLFIVTSDSGAVSNVDVTQASLYSLQLLGANGIDTYVTGNVLYIRNSPTCILNATSQVLGVGTASVTAGNIAEFDGNIKVNGRIAAGAHTSLASAVVHLKEDAPELRIETVASGIAYETFVDDSGNNFKWTANFVTPGANFLDLSWDSNRLVRFGNSSLIVDNNVTMNGSANHMTGNLTVDGILTAGGLIATATDVLINNGPVTISGGWSFIADGAIEHDKLTTISGGYLLMGNTSNIATAIPITGDVTFTPTGLTMINPGVVTLGKLASTTSGNILGGTGTAVASLDCDNNGQVLFDRSGTNLIFTIKTGSITNEMISPATDITMDKIAFSTNISGIVLNNGVLELTPDIGNGPKPDVLFRSVPVGTIITWGGNIIGLSSTGIEEPVTGWFFCNGADYNISTYSDLYDAIGTAWGAAGKLPNLMGSFLRCVDPSGVIDKGWGTRSGGNADKIGSSQAGELLAHTHTFTDNYYPLDSHYAQGAGSDPTVRPVTNTQYNASDVTASAGGTETRPYNFAVVYLIKY